MKKDIVILGASGFATDLLWVLEDNIADGEKWNFLGFVDRSATGASVDGYPVLGDDEWLLSYPHEISVLCGLGFPATRRRVAAQFLNQPNIHFPPLISCTAQLSRHSSIGNGSVLCHGVRVAPNAKIGCFSMLNLNVTIGHDSVLRDYIMVNPGTNISGNVTIDDGCDIGTGVRIIPGKHIGANTVIGAGSVIIRDIPGNCTVVGNPGRILEKK